MSDTSLLFNFLKGRDTASPHMRTVSNNATAMASRIKLSSIAAAAGTATLVAGLASLGAQGVALVSSLAPAVGILGLLPSLGVGAAFGIGTLVMAFSGLGDALKRTAGSAGASSQAIAAAERRIELAQRGAAQAQAALNDARQTAAERLADVNRELNRARLDEEGAVLAVADAERALRDARRSGNRSAIQHAELSYRESVQALEEVRARLADVAAEEQDRNAKGVEGSDEVQTALQRQADALREVADAQAALNTGGGGPDKAAQAYAKLTAEGRALVDVLRAMAPAWRGVQQAVQASVLRGVAGDIRALSMVYLPVMKSQLPAIGQGWNNAFRGSLQLASSAGFVQDINAALANMATFWQRVGAAAAPFLSGFRHWLVVGSTFLPRIGGWVQSLAVRFDRWSDSVRRTGKAHAWISNAITVLGQLWAITKNLAMSVVAIFRAGSGGPNWLPGLVAGTAALRGFLESPGGQEKLAAVFTTLRNIGSQLWGVLEKLGPALLNLFANGEAVQNTFSVMAVVVGFAADHLDDFAKWLPVIIAGFIAYKALQSAAIVLDTIRIPLLIAQVVANMRLAAALTANTAALTGNQIVAKRSLIGMAAMRVAAIAGAVAAGVATAAQWLWNVAMTANPIGLIIVGIAALIAVIVLIATKTTWFQTIWRVTWGAIKVAAQAVGEWFAGPFVNFWVAAWNFLKGLVVGYYTFVFNIFLKVVDFVASVPGKIAAAARGMWDGVKEAFRAVLNWIYSKWNSIHLTLPSINLGPLGSFGGFELRVPQIPYLETGGTITRGGAAVVADRNGQGGEVVSLPRGAQVSPLPTGGGVQRVELVLRGTDREFLTFLRKIIKDNGGLQVALG